MPNNINQRIPIKSILLLTVFGIGTINAGVYEGSEFADDPVSIDALVVKRILENKMEAGDLFIKDILERLKKSLAQGGVLEIYSCNSGEGEAGKDLEKELSKYFGQEIKLSETQVRQGFVDGVVYDKK